MVVVFSAAWPPAASASVSPSGAFAGFRLMVPNRVLNELVLGAILVISVALEWRLGSWSV